MKPPDVGIDQQISQQGELERFLHQKSQQTCKPLLLRPERIDHDQGKICQSITLDNTHPR